MQIEHDPRGQKFYVKGRELEVMLAYTEVNNIIDIHQIVSDSLENSITEQLVLYVFRWAGQNGYKIFSENSYITSKFLPMHPELKGVFSEAYM